jgi:hypothetical protein
MIATLQFLAILSGALFSGAALYVNVAEHPARMRLEPRIAVLQWAPSYGRATWLQAPLAIISFISGALVYLLGGSLYWIVGAALVGSVVPYTFAIMMPINKQLLAAGQDSSGLHVRILLERWARLHAVRTALSLAGTVVYLWQLTVAGL